MPKKDEKKTKKTPPAGKGATSKGKGSSAAGKKPSAPSKKAAPKEKKVQPHPLEEKFADLGLEGDFLNALPPALLSSIPPEMLKAFQEALHSGKEDALLQALEGMSQEERVRMLELVETTARDMGIEPDEIQSAEEDLLLDEHREFIHLVAELALGDPPIELRTQVEKALANLEADGWHLVSPVRRIWDGERDVEALTDGLDWDESILVGGILESIDRLNEFRAHRAALIATFPSEFQAAFRSGDPESVEEALEKLPPEEQTRFKDAMDELLIEAGIHTPEELEEEEDEILETFYDLIEDIADIARGEGDGNFRRQVEREIEELEDNGWNLLTPVRRIWDGERNLATLTTELPNEECVIVQAILEQILVEN